MARKTYLYFVEFDDGRVHVHSGLSKTRAAAMYKAQNKGDMHGLRRFGWELEETSPLTGDIALSQLRLKQRAAQSA